MHSFAYRISMNLILAVLIQFYTSHSKREHCAAKTSQGDDSSVQVTPNAMPAPTEEKQVTRVTATPATGTTEPGRPNGSPEETSRRSRSRQALANTLILARSKSEREKRGNGGPHTTSDKARCLSYLLFYPLSSLLLGTPKNTCRELCRGLESCVSGWAHVSVKKFL